MNKIAVFGKPGGGKSTLSRQLSAATGIEYFPLDLIEYQKNGERITRDEFMKKHTELIQSDRWIIDGLGVLESFWQRIDAADTIIYIDLPYSVHYWWITKRLLKSITVKPEGWPEGSSVLKGTMVGWKYLRLSQKFWTPELLQEIKLRAKDKNFHHIKSTREISTFINDFKKP